MADNGALKRLDFDLLLWAEHLMAKADLADGMSEKAQAAVRDLLLLDIAKSLRCSTGRADQYFELPRISANQCRRCGEELEGLHKCADFKYSR